MARSIATRALAGGHRVVLVGTALGKAEDLADELRDAGDVTAAEAVDGELVVLAVPFTAAPHVVREHAERLTGSTLVDITNPVDLGAFEPLDTAPFRSGAELIAAAAPAGVPLIKAFNTTLAGPLLAGEVAGRPLDVFMAGDDADAKGRVAQLVADGGMRPIDAGELRRARELEATGFLHMAVQAELGGTWATAIAVLQT
jgi:predicted dinucleotide-binding enzyme